MRLSNLSLHDLVLRHFGSSLVRALQGRVRPLGGQGPCAPRRLMRSKPWRARKLEEDLDARVVLVIAKADDLDQAEQERQLKNLEAERLKLSQQASMAVHLPPRRGRRSRLSPTQQAMTRAARIARGR